MTDPIKYIFDPATSGKDEALCSPECRHRVSGTAQATFVNVIRMLLCFLFGKPFITTVCQHFGITLEVFQDGEQIIVRRCEQCRNVERFLVPLDYATPESEPIAPYVSRQPRADDLLRKDKGHLAPHLHTVVRLPVERGR
jgi:hypothetical protein